MFVFVVTANDFSAGLLLVAAQWQDLTVCAEGDHMVDHVQLWSTELEISGMQQSAVSKRKANRGRGVSLHVVY